MFRLGRGDTVAVALSGGVDSALAARRIQQAGIQVAAFHLILSPQIKSLPEAQKAAKILELDLHVLDISQEFERLVVDPFVQGYLRGETPSPCVACNPAVKFGLLASQAAGLGARYLATGHYAGLNFPAGEGPPGLVRPRDSHKDQTYFLCRLKPEHLESAVFPLADMTKDEVRKEAEQLGLVPKAESQEICFLAGSDYRSFLDDRLDKTSWGEGCFVDTDGRELGRHKGFWRYTVGQRRGLGLPGPEPYYVLALRPDTNEVVLGTKLDTFARAFSIRDLVLSQNLEEPVFIAHVQVRSRHRPAPATVEVLGNGMAEVTFNEPQSAIAPGQAAAIYQGKRLLGGGWIDSLNAIAEESGR
jgi:tRNA-specific 2-thiouridylase